MIYRYSNEYDEHDEHEEVQKFEDAYDEAQRLREIRAAQKQQLERTNTPIPDSSANDRSKKSKDARTGNFRCAPCDKTFETQQRLEQHARDKHDIILRNKCTPCNKKPFGSQSSLEQHERENHGV
ncbi:hypothetical protein ACHAPD_002588 [Fusarium lateritium]